MRIQSSVGTVVGVTSDTRWGQVIQTPGAYGIVEVEADTDARRKGIEILTRLSQALSDPPVSLSALAALATNTVTAGVRSIALLVPVGNIVYLTLRGEGAVYLKRGSKVAQLLAAEGNLSGQVEPGDMILLISSALAQAFSAAELSGVFDHLPAKDAAEKLTLLLHTRQGYEGAAALIFSVDALESTNQPASSIESQREAAVASGRPMITMWRRRAVHAARFMTPRKLRWIGRAILSSLRLSKAGTVVTVLLVFLFVTSVILGVAKRTAGQKNEQVSRAMEQARHAYEEGVALYELNPVKAREKLAQAKSLLEPVVSGVSRRSAAGRPAYDLLDQIHEQLESSLQITVSQPELFYDVSLLKKDSTVTAFTLFGDSLALFDSRLATAYGLTVDTKNGQILAGGTSLTSGQLVALYGNFLYVWTPTNIMRISTTERIVSQAVAPSPQWGSIRALTAYGGNLYLLDSTKSRIWKYMATDAGAGGKPGFSELREYLNPDTLPDLSEATSMAIDGSVWVGTSAGRILRFTQGREDTYVPKGVEPGISGSIVVFTNDSTKSLYVLESAAKRVIVLDKEGFYLSQYRWEGPIFPTGFLVSERAKKIFLLSEGRVYAIQLK